ncbi:choice-of-anchor M domain-containing protein [Actinotalea sp. BY-33]|uniref:Choice-of-anchor M domain-containing protein n=1 Tax=Actinotalea soli TaxID=2819234 RepID=A0A939LNG9_9CELL|nr:choice-of-anchor M domain-containing protein [Actinotalea soli]MBO1751036.1 choice-of-anchor M domain-containing protein [Actinotalea soli]
MAVAVLLTAALGFAGGTPAVALGTEVDPGLDQRVGAGEETVEGREVISQGHLDVGPRFLDGEWTFQARDDRSVPPVWRAPEETVLHVLDESVLPAPDGPDFAFLDVEPGQPLYVVPQVQNQDVVWIGWNTQDPEVTQRIDRGATLRLNGMEGPGEVFLFLQEGVTGPPNLLWDSGVDGPQDLWMEVNTHVHANWVFTEPGVYTLDVSVLADLTDGTSVEDAGVLRFAIGTATDPQDAFAVADDPQESPSPTETEAAEAEQDDGAGEEEPTDEPAEPQAQPETESAVGAVGLWVGLAVLVLAGVVTFVVLQGRRARAVADAEADARSGGAGGPDEPRADR